jgi:membrane-bound lytic murein transglycosylase D
MALDGRVLKKPLLSRHVTWVAAAAVLIACSVAGARRRSARSRKRPSSHGRHHLLIRPLDTNRTRRGHIRGRPLPEIVRGDALQAMEAFEQAGLLRRAVKPRASKRPARKGKAKPRGGPKARESGHESGHESEHGASAKVRQPRAPTDAPQWMQNLKLPAISIRWNRKLIDYLRFYHNTSRGKNILRSWFKKMGRYESLIRRQLTHHKLPQDLIHVAMIESGFRADCSSYAGAAGLWQFMPFGGRIYGLAYNYWIDERRNPERSTRAAMLYLKDLYQRFGSWHLALAAYNAGYGAVSRAIRRFNTNDYWKLCQLEAGLPYATMNYVPKVLAVAIAGRNKAEFGLENVSKEPQWDYETVTVRRAVHLRHIAKAAGVSYEAVEELNPELRRHRVPPGYASFQVRVPKGSKKTFLANASRRRLMPKGTKVYRVRFGDDLGSIAKKFSTSSSRIRRLNSIRTRSEVVPGLELVVPDRPDRESRGAGAGRRMAAEKSGQSGEKILVAVPARPPSAPAGWRCVYYRVTAGDSLDGLAKAFRAKKSDLAYWNNLSKGAKIQRGMILRVYVPPSSKLSHVRLLDPDDLEVVVVDSPAFREARLERRGLKRIVYEARKRDTIRKLSRKFGLSMGSIARLNDISRFSKLEPGQKLVIYVKDESKAKGTKGRSRRDGKDRGERSDAKGRRPARRRPAPRKPAPRKPAPRKPARSRPKARPG